MVLNNYRYSKVKLDIRGVRISLEEILFYTGLILWLIQMYITRTIFADFFSGRLLTAVRYFCMLIFLVKIIILCQQYLKHFSLIYLFLYSVV